MNCIQLYQFLEDVRDPIPLPMWPLMLFSSQLCSWCNHSCPDRIYVWRQRLGRPNLFNICGSLGEADSTLETGWGWNKSTIRKKDVWSTASFVRIEFISCFQVIVIITRCWSYRLCRSRMLMSQVGKMDPVYVDQFSVKEQMALCKLNLLSSTMTLMW